LILYMQLIGCSCAERLPATSAERSNNGNST